jgi:polysaccharide deacetylase family protein (PEP-CTERM system associated)
MEITFTLDLEDNWWSSDRDRFLTPARALLDLTTSRGIRGTVFVVGELAVRVPDLVREFAAAGHEIGLHGWTHAPLPSRDIEMLRADVKRGRATLEDIVQQPVAGFRAPYFSLVPESRGIVGVLADAGFRYSSSVLPARNPQFGWPACPARPFVWTEGICELPVPVARRGERGLPFLGGIYLRLLPKAVIDTALARASGDQLLWTYCHPYDVDPHEPFCAIPDLGWPKSRLLWARRGAMLAKLDALLAGRTGAPLGERVDALRRSGGEALDHPLLE